MPSDTTRPQEAATAPPPHSGTIPAPTTSVAPSWRDSEAIPDRLPKVRRGRGQDMRTTGDVLGGIIAPHVTGQPSHVCPVCGDTVQHRQAELLGRIIYRPSRCECEKAIIEQEDKEVADRERDIRVQRHFDESGLHLREVSMRFSTFEREWQPDAYTAARHFGHTAEGWAVLILSGDVGTGKTHLAAAVARAFCLRDQSARFIDIPALRREITATFDKGNPGPTEAKIIATYASVGLLALDDWGAEGNQSPWFDGIMFSLVNARYAAQLPLVITTNKGRKEFSNWIGARLTSRITEGSTWITMLPKDYRVLGRKARHQEPD